MNQRNKLIELLSLREEPPLALLDEFFEGNADLGSIGCNLDPHPGLDAFRERLGRLAARPDVVAVYVCIAELDPGDDSWPFSDTVFVVGPVALSTVADAVSELEPDEVRAMEADEILDLPDALHGAAVTLIWWD